MTTPPTHTRTDNEQRIDSLEAQCVTMREALEFYAHKTNWRKEQHEGSLYNWTTIEAVIDGGRTARSALARLDALRSKTGGGE